MVSKQAEGRLRELLASAGVDVNRPTVPDVERTWAVWRTFAEESVEDAEPRDVDGDGVLAQFGAYGEGGAFQLDMTRQFTFADADGEYDGMTQLFCTFTFAASESLIAVGDGNLWSFDFALPEFFDEALALPGFALVRSAGAVPTALDIGYGGV